MCEQNLKLNIAPYMLTVPLSHLSYSIDLTRFNPKPFNYKQQGYESHDPVDYIHNNVLNCCLPMSVLSVLMNFCTGTSDYSIVRVVTGVYKSKQNIYGL